MSHKDYDFTIALRVCDADALFLAAVNHRAQEEAASNSFWPDDPVAHFGPDYRNELGVDIEACLIEIFDPGLSPDGCEIQESYATRVGDIDDDEEGEEGDD